MTIFYPLSGASWPARKQASVNIEEPQSHAKGTPCRGTPRQWELRKVASLPILDADYWCDANSFTLPHLAAKLPESVDTTASSLLSLYIEAPPLHSPTSLQVVNCSRSVRCAAFPPPLESPFISDEGPFHHLQSIDKVCFTSIRSNGRLLLRQMPYIKQTWGRLRSQRRNGRLLLQLYEESDDPIAETMKQEDPFAEKAVGESLTAEKARQEDPIAEKARLKLEPKEDKTQRGTKENPIGEKTIEEGAVVKKARQVSEREDATCALLVADQEEKEVQKEEGELEAREEEGGGGERKLSIYTKVLKTLDCDAFSDCSAEVASFIHKSLFRVRPLDMLNLWQY